MSKPISKPMLFSGPMVRALLEGRKTQTRRIVKPQPIDGETIIYDNPGFAVGRLRDSENAWIKVFPKHEVGFEIWVREAWAPTLRGVEPDGWQDLIEFPADGTKIEVPKEHVAWFDRVSDRGYHNRPSIHMPRWASRITLKVTDVRAQRLQDISEEDAEAEGIEGFDDRGLDDAQDCWRNYMRPIDHESAWFEADRLASYGSLWESINGPGSWSANPWVWAYTFEVKR